LSYPILRCEEAARVNRSVLANERDEGALTVWLLIRLYLLKSRQIQEGGTMEAKANGAKRFVRRRAGAYLSVLLLVAATGSYARDEWFRSLDLEPSLGEASPVLAGRVVDVSETKIMMGGKVETPLIQFKFAPLVVLKGVFSRAVAHKSGSGRAVFYRLRADRAWAGAAADVGAVESRVREHSRFSRLSTVRTASKWSG
jgi:hypothetical protein